MSRDKVSTRYKNYNIDKLESLIFVAMLANEKSIRVPKRLYKVAKQLLALNNCKDMTIKTY